MNPQDWQLLRLFSLGTLAAELLQIQWRYMIYMNIILYIYNFCISQVNTEYNIIVL